MTGRFKCLICGADALETIGGFAEFPRVTSDCKPWPAGGSTPSARMFGLFGTAISGMWVYGALRDKVSFFVDEDPSRVGNSFEGLPILSPSQAPAGITVFVPLLPKVARRGVGRHTGSEVAYVEPPSRY
jgi:hypothetical protein